MILGGDLYQCIVMNESLECAPNYPHTRLPTRFSLSLYDPPLGKSHVVTHIQIPSYSQPSGISPDYVSESTV